MMKRTASLLIFAALLFSLCACASKPAAPSEGSRDGYVEVLNSACELTKNFDRALMDKVVPPGETDYFIDFYREKKNEDYIEALGSDYARIAAEYDEYFGDDWKLTCTVLDAEERDEAGIQQYRDFDSYFFSTYGYDPAKVDAVTIVKVKLHIEGSKASNDKEKTLQFFRTGGEWYSFYAARLGINLIPKGEGSN